MAASLSNKALTFTNLILQLGRRLSFRLLDHKFHPFGPEKHHNRHLSSARPAVSKTREPLPSYIIEVEKEQPADTLQNPKNQCENISYCWRKLLGEDNWAGLLEPMHPLMREELIRYGIMAQACYDAFDYDPSSKYTGSSRFGPKEFFDKLGWHDSGYKVTRFLYATSNINLPNFFKKSRWPKIWSKNANWIGYVAVSNDELTKKLGRRDVCVAWRGTVTHLEWLADLTDFLRPVSNETIPCPDPKVKVESGFLDLYRDKERSCKYCKFSAREQILTEINRLVHEVYADEEVSVTMTGHSLGGALAKLCAYDIAETGLNIRNGERSVPVCAFTFAAPRLGNMRFKERLDLLGVKVLRVVNVHDIVPKSPGFILNEKVHPRVMKMLENLPWAYSHVGEELVLDHLNSPFLRPDGDLACAHNLEAYLHLIDGYPGKGESFVLANGRDIALINKGSDFLKDEYEVPTFWRQDQNKGMVYKDGRWVQEHRLIPHDDPTDTMKQLTRIGLVSDTDDDIGRDW